MRRHELDLFSLVAGLLFTSLSVVFLGAAWSDTNLDGRWVLPVVLVTLGVASLAGLVKGRDPYAGIPREPVTAPSDEAAADTEDTLVLSREESEER